MPRSRSDEGKVAPVATAKRDDQAITSKVADIESQQQFLLASQAKLAAIGAVDSGVEEQIAFQIRRQEILAEAALMKPAGIKARIEALNAELGPDGQKLKYGGAVALPRDVLEKVSEVELLELCMGEHPGQQRVKTHTVTFTGGNPVPTVS